jgi:hypothetical protein
MTTITTTAAPFPDDKPNTRTISNYKSYQVVMTYESEARHWGIRFEHVGWQYVFALTMNLRFPSIRIVVLGCSVSFGRLKDKPKQVGTTFGSVDANTTNQR